MSLETYADAQQGGSGEQVAARICSGAESWISGGPPELAIVFALAHFADEYQSILGDLMIGLKPKHLVGCSG